MWLNLQFPEDLITFTEDFLNGKLHFLCSGIIGILTVLLLITPQNRHYLETYKCHFFSETYLDSYIQHDDKTLLLYGYTLARTDNPDNNERGGIGVYFK